MIIIIGVIALIVAPIILNIVNKSKKSAFLDSAYGLVESAKLLYAESILDGGLSEEKTFSFDNGKPEGLNYSGESPKGGMITLSSDGRIEIAVHNGEWCATKGQNESEVVLKRYEEQNCILPQNEQDPVIRLNGEDFIYLGINEIYKELGAKAYTKIGDPLEYSVIIKKGNVNVDSVDTSIEENYQIIYEATSNGKTASVTRTIVVIHMAPMITMTDSNDVYVKEKEILINVSAIRPNNVFEFTYEIKKDGVSIHTEIVNGLSKMITLNETGIYEVIVSVTDNNGHKNTLNKIYKIDHNGPVITVPEETRIKSNLVMNYDLLEGVSAIDAIDGEVIPTYTGNLSAIPGIYTIVYKAVDHAGNETFKSRVITVIESDGPILSFMPAETNGYVKEISIVLSAVDHSDISCMKYQIIKDSVAGEVVNVVVTGKEASEIVTLSETGRYRIQLTGIDAHGNISELESGEYLIDHSGPEIMFDPEIINLESEQVLKYNLLTGVSVRDNVDGVINNNQITTSGTLVKAPGTYKIIYTVSDRLGNRSSKERTFIVSDQTKPEVTITPNEESTFVKTKTVTITATDNIKVSTIQYVIIKDNVRGAVQTISNGGTVTLNDGTGEYQLEVTAIDSSNNRRVVTSGVYKIDRTNPIITFDPENVILKVTQVSNYDLMTGVTVSDNSGIRPTIQTEGTLSAVVGIQTVTYIATDSAGNETRVVRNFTVVEAEGPILNFSSASSNKYIKATTITITATDNSNLKTFTYEVFKNNVSQGVNSVNVSGKSASANVSLSTTANYYIKLTASDIYDNHNSITSGVYKIDTVAPILTVPSATTIYSTQVSGYNLMTGVTYSDNSGITPSVTTSGTLQASAGTYVITYKAIDEAGNTTTKSRTFTVKVPGSSEFSIDISSIGSTYPGGIATRKDGGFYVYNGGRNTVVTYNSSGKYVSEITVPSIGGTYPGAISTTSDGGFYLYNGGRGEIYKYSSTGTLEKTISKLMATDGGYTGDMVAATDGGFYLYLSYRSRVYKYSSAGVLEKTIDVQPIGNGWKGSLSSASNGGFYLYNGGRDTVYKYDSSGNVLSTISVSSIGSGYALGVSEAIDGSVYIYNGGRNIVWKYSSTGVLQYSINSSSIGYEFAGSIDASLDGGVFVYNGGRCTVTKFS